jgi:regulator of protease activity HflC (stomatin/prohibitin superfamily)
MITLYALAAAFGIGVLWLGTNIKVVKQFERGVVFRFGRVQSGLRGPGLTMLIPIADRLENHSDVKNYDGSWTEYGSLVGVPIELGDGK